MSKEKILSEEAATLLNDPQCVINTSNTGAINYYHAPSPANIQDAMDAISQLGFADIWRVPPFRITMQSVTLEVRAVLAGGGRNWLLLINGINGASTIAAITVQGNLATASTEERRTYVQSMTRSALVHSLNTALSIDVNGPCR